MLFFSYLGSSLTSGLQLRRQLEGHTEQQMIRYWRKQLIGAKAVQQQ